MWDLADSKHVRQLLEAFYLANKPIGAVCHGVAALLTAKDGQGVPIVKNKQLTCFSNAEETSARLADIVPFLLETELVLLGAHYTKGAVYTSHVVIDEKLITGQNPASSFVAAQKVIEMLGKN